MQKRFLGYNWGENLIVVLISILVNACGSAEKQSASPEMRTTTNSAKGVASLPISYDHFEVIRAIKQPKSMDCWATALTCWIVIAEPAGGTPSASGAKGNGKRTKRVAV